MRIKFLRAVSHKRVHYDQDYEVLIDDVTAEYFISNGWAVDLGGHIAKKRGQHKDVVLSIDKAQHRGLSKWEK